eukprot:3937997-Rhodomonas_salina.2
MSVTFDTSHLERSPLKEDAPANMWLIDFTELVLNAEMSALKDDAPSNMRAIDVTLEVSHLDMFALKVDGRSNLNIPSMFLTFLVFHLEISALKANTMLNM